MAKKSQRKSKQSPDKQEDAKPLTNEPWLSKRTGLIAMVILSIILIGFMVWQLYPGMGLESILWGLGFAASIWVVFGIFYLFNTFVRGRR